jgi:phosphatidylinositol glycan class B
MIFMIVPFLIWRFIFKGTERKSLAKVLTGIFFAIILSTFIDYLGYGNWTFTPYNYYYQNIVLKVASSFGVDPWWKYFDFVLLKGIPPLSLLFLITAIYHWITRPFSVYSFVSIPFFIVHSMVAHKELRFIFPMWIFLPFFIAEAFEKLPKLFKFVWKPYLVLSIPFLIYSSFIPAHSPIEFYKYIFYEKETIDRIYTMHLIRDQLFFYQKNPVELVHIPDLEKLDMVFDHPDKAEWLLTDQTHERDHFLNLKNCEIKYQTYSDFIINLADQIGLENRWKVWTLFRCD